MFQNATEFSQGELGRAPGARSQIRGRALDGQRAPLRVLRRGHGARVPARQGRHAQTGRCLQ